jgi:hypothetical protein
MMFVKWISVFEDRKYANQMILWLLLQFPTANTSTLKFINRHSKMKMDFNALPGPGSPARPHESSSDSHLSSDDEANNQTYHYFGILDYLFPYRKFQQILDNLSNYQVIDLYQRMSGAAAGDLRQASIPYDTTLTQIDREYIWPLPTFKKDLSKEVLHLAIKAKFEETV